MTPFSQWPMSHIVMAHGVLLSVATGVKMLATTWTPSEAWLLYLLGSMTATFATKRLTYRPDSPQNRNPDGVSV